LPLFSQKNLVQEVWPREEIYSHNLARHLEKQVSCVYAGFDPTADSLHIGNLLILLGLLHFQRAGHKVLALLGGATGRIGDPSGKNSEREEIPVENLQSNLHGIQKDVENIFDNHRKYFWNESAQGVLSPVQIINNETFYQDMNIIDFLSKVGRNMRVSKMIARHSVKSRLESEAGISLTEFIYQAFQAYDWLHLVSSHDCRVQLGGSDQLGNLAAGYELISRVYPEDKAVWGITLPLVVNEEGNKLGKSAGAPVWLSKDKTSPFQFYQYFRRLPDAQAEQLIRQFTFFLTQ